jgi:transposase
MIGFAGCAHRRGVDSWRRFEVTVRDTPLALALFLASLVPRCTAVARRSCRAPCCVRSSAFPACDPRKRVLLTTRHSAVLAATAAINHLKALIVSAPEDLRSVLRGKYSAAQVSYCAELTDRPDSSLEHRMTIRAMRSAARRVVTSRSEAKDLETELASLVQQIAPDLITLAGVGPISAAHILISWSHSGRFRSEAAFAAFAGAAPIPASSGMAHRHRLNRGGDRQLNRALYTITLIRMRVDPATRAYIAKRGAEGKTSRDAQRCIKRALARTIFKLLERTTLQDPFCESQRNLAAA